MTDGVLASLDLLRLQGMSTRLRLAGHSLGGADVFSLANSLSGTKYKITEMDLFAFYPMDLFDFTVLNHMSGHSGAEGAKMIAALSDSTVSRISEMERAARSTVSQMSAIFQFWGFKGMVDGMFDPHIHTAMSMGLRKFFTERADLEAISAANRDAWISYNVQVELAMTKGARSFNLLHPRQGSLFSARGAPRSRSDLVRALNS